MSSYLAPTSWAGNPRTLGMAMPLNPLVAMIPSGKQIFFVELQPDLSVRNARLSSHVGSASNMTFIVNQNAFEDSLLYQILTKSLLGGWSNLNSKKNIPYKHPYLYGMYAKDIIENVPFEPQVGTLGEVWGNYNLAKVTVSFESLNYPVALSYSPSGDYNPNWIEWKWVSTNNRVSQPLGWYKFTSGPYSGFPSSFGSWKVLPYTNITATIYNCTRTMVFGGAALSQKPLISLQSGYVNDNTFGGWNTQQLLLDSAEIQQYRDWLGVELFNVRLNLIGNEWGWNKQPDPEGNINTVAFVLGGATPFPTTNFITMFNTLNPR